MQEGKHDAAGDQPMSIQALHYLTEKMQNIIHGCEQHLLMHPDVPRSSTEFTREKAVNLWMQTRRIQPDANLEAERLNLYDLFFIALCYLRAQEDPKRLKSLEPVQQNMQTLLSTVQQMAVDIQCDKPPQLSLDDAFDLCASVVVYVYSQGVDAVMDSIYQYVKTETQVEEEQKKADFDVALESLGNAGGSASSSSTDIDTKSDTSTSNAVLRGITDTKSTGLLTEDELMVAEMRKAEQQDIDATQASMTAARIASDFIPVCSNTFLNLWLQKTILGEFKVTADIKEMDYTQPNTRLETKEDRKRFDEWWQVSLIDPTAAFNRLWRDIAYRMWTVPGMSLFVRRSALASEEVLPAMSLLQLQHQNERKKSDDLIKISLTRPQDILKAYREGQKLHVMLPFLLIGMFVYQFQQQVNKNITFVDTYIILPDRLGDVYYKLAATTNEHGRLRLPLIVILLGKWYILDQGRLLRGADAIGALLTWTRIVMLDKRFNGSTEDGYSIIEWFKQLCLQQQ